MGDGKSTGAQGIITAALTIRQKAESLKKYGVEINSVLVSDTHVSVSVEKGIEKLAGAMGAELTKSPKGYHLGFDFENVHFGQRIKENYEDLY